MVDDKAQREESAKRKESWEDKNKKFKKKQTPGKGSGKGNSTAPGNTADQRPAGKCYKCNEPGHISINCTKKEAWKCNNCNEKGHVAKDCTAESKNEGSGQSRGYLTAGWPHSRRGHGYCRGYNLRG